MSSEGFIQYRLEHQFRALDRNRYADQVCKLAAWREVLSLAGLVGQDPRRYGGAGFGNVSSRVGPPSSGRGRRTFLITGTQTGAKRTVGMGEFALVEEYDYNGNRLTSHGTVQPSSEALTHAALYDMGPQIRCVLHAHSPAIWQRSKEMRLPTTDPSAGYGTPEMALEVQRLYAGTGLAESRLLAMGGHQDGVVVFGHTLEEAGQVLLTALARAIGAKYAAGGLTSNRD